MHIMTTALTASAMLTVLPPAAVTAAPVHTLRGAASVADISARQAVLDRLADEITGVPEHERATLPGYAGHTVDPQHGRLDLYWQGDVPDRVSGVLSRMPAELTAAVHPAPYSLRDLRAARDRLSAVAARGESGAVWTTVGPQADGSGLAVTYTPNAERHRDVPTSEDVAALAATIAGVPVSALPTASPSAAANRHSDASPWSAGAELITPSNAWCTSGFGGWRGRTPVLLTAEHCGTSGSYKTGGGTVIGTAADADTALDTTVINVSGSPSGRFYDGAWNNESGYSKRVVGAGRNNVGDLVCNSGSVSGIHCGLKITATDVAATVDGVWRSDLDTAVRTDDSTVTVAGGDSGGPVVASINGEDMQARGIMSAGSGNRVVCGSVAVQTTCYDTVLFVPIGPIVSKFGLSLA
ncbi:S1 family peptidase [Kitasatospora sp. NPDC058201]|uniref:S1 family peptidase n=1 Tax=unclassified Kitasatospora TaxID=2633591 RepID=UPI00364BC07D